METKNVQMTAQEAEEFRAYQADKAKKEAAAKAKEDRDAYATLVDETIDVAVPLLMSISAGIAETKTAVLEQFKQALAIKADLFGTKEGQRSHTFTNADGDKRIMIGYYVLDGWRDTVEDGIAKVKEAIESLAKDDESRALVAAILRLLSKDQKGTLKASRVLQLRKLAEDSHNEKILEGVRIIEDSYQPTESSQFIKSQIKNDKGEWVSVPLGMTEA